MSLLKDLTELVSADIISNDTALQITEFYKRKQDTSPNRMLLIFGILGALLVGTGVMFIVANQWEELPQSIQTVCAFLLLIVPQSLCGYVMLKKPQKIVWRESTALILFFAVGASISLVSQIYHINGEMSSFMLTWMLLTAPLIYLMDSSAVSLAYLFGIMIYCPAARYNLSYPFEEYLYWLLLLIPMPRYILLYKKAPDQILTYIHHWMIPFVLTMTLGYLSHSLKMLMYPAYIIMFGIFYMTGNSARFRKKPLIANGYLVFGFIGTVILLLIMSFKSTWKDIIASNFHISHLLIAPEFIALLILFVLASLLFFQRYKDTGMAKWNLTNTVFILFLVIFIVGTQDTSLAVILDNLLIFALGILMLRAGTKQSRLGVINTGMLVIALLVVCRSFDTDLTFVVKGILFILVGIGFFAANWLMIKKTTKNEA